MTKDRTGLKVFKSNMLGNNLKALRQEKCKISQEQLCARLQSHGFDIPRYAYAKIEQGRQGVSVDLLFLLTEIFDCDFNDLFLGPDLK